MKLALALPLALAASTLHAQEFSTYPPYVPEAHVTGTLTVWGNDGMVNLEKLWEDAFHKFQPDIQFDDHLYSTAAGFGGLYAGHADLALMGRDSWQVENLGFTKTFGYDVTRFVATTGAYKAEAKTFPMVLFVHKGNPLTQLSLQQLDALFGTERRLGGSRALRTWGDLGLIGEWADKPVHLYGYPDTSGFGIFFSGVALGGSPRFNCDIREFDNLVDSHGKTITSGGQRILDALAKDKYGLAYSGTRYAGPDVVPIAIAASPNGPFIAPTLENTLNRTYPLIRDIPIYINRAPGQPIDPKVHEFLSFIFSREGQQAVSREGDYLPITLDVLNQQRAHLK